MHIAMITGEYPPMKGGVGAYTHQLAAALIGAGHRVSIVTTPPPGAAPNRTSEEGIHVERVIERWDVGGMLQARRRLRDLAPDAVNLQYEPAAYGMRGSITFARALFQLPARAALVVTFHDLLPPYLFPKAGPLRRRRVRQLARRADGVILTNREDLRQLTQPRDSRLPPTRLIPIGSNISAEPPAGYHRAQWRRSHGYAPDDLVIGFFGFLNRTKGVETLLTSLSALVAEGRPAHLLFIGGRTGTSDATNAAYAAEIDALIDRLDMGSQVQRTGFVEPAEVSAALLGVDVCALPFREGANLRHGTLHAALAHGCLIVTTATTMPDPELRDHEHVLLVPPDDAPALARAITTVATDPDLRQRLRSGAHALAARFTWPRIATDVAAFFEELRAGRDGSPSRPMVE